jgi:RNA polymerase sigma-70 factor (ECF subfamily)
VGLRRELNATAPRLRRYARALISGHPGPNEAADVLVAAALRRVFVDGASVSAADIEIDAYAALIDLNREHNRETGFGGGPAQAASAMRKAGSYSGGGGPPERLRSIPLANDTLCSALLALKLEEREVLLLVCLEGFSYQRAARILRISRSILVARLARARERLPRSEQARPASGPARQRPPHLRLVE